jgi:hypothetical protein
VHRKLEEPLEDAVGNELSDFVVPLECDTNDLTLRVDDRTTLERRSDLARKEKNEWEHHS